MIVKHFLVLLHHKGLDFETHNKMILENILVQVELGLKVVLGCD